MKIYFKVLAFVSCTLVLGCQPTSELTLDAEPQITKQILPETSNLASVHPSPKPSDACQVIGENAAEDNLISNDCQSMTELDFDSEPKTTKYTLPEVSNLIGVRPYPNPDDVCQVIGENYVTRDLMRSEGTLIGCPKHERGAIEDRMNEGATVVAHAKHWTLLRVPPSQSISSGKKTKDELRKLQQEQSRLRQFFSDTTLVSWDSFHGTQLEYHDAKGGVWLVYPGNKTVLPGEWKVELAESQLSLCYRYFTNGKNPATGVRGIEWECSLVASRASDRDSEYYEGDIFRLFQRKSFPDSPILRRKSTITELIDLFKVSPPRVRGKSV